MFSGKQGVKVRLDDAVLEELERAGPGNVKQIGERLSGRVYEALERLVLADKVSKEGFLGKGHEKTYSLRQPDPIKRRF
jgi:hypothetical protein